MAAIAAVTFGEMVHAASRGGNLAPALLQQRGLPIDRESIPHNGAIHSSRDRV
jgi:hypothetical protein